MMSKPWQVGLFAKDDSYMEEIIKFTHNLIKDKNENIIQEKRSYGMSYFEILTDKSRYIFRVVNDGVRGYRWHEVYIFDAELIDKEILDYCVYPKIMPYDMWNRDVQWRAEKYIHYLSKN